MKLLAFSDLHLDRARARRLAERSRSADVVVGAGDFGRFHLGLRRTIEPLESISTPTVLVPGNNETDSALWRASADWPSATVLHGEAKEIGGVTFFGLGGGIPVTPFPWGFDLTEEQAAQKLEACPDGAVLVIHSPPKGYVDRVNGRNLGSESILKAIEDKRPPLAICGHIHQCWGHEARIGATRVVNAGPDGIMLEL